MPRPLSVARGDGGGGGLAGHGAVPRGELAAGLPGRHHQGARGHCAQVSSNSINVFQGKLEQHIFGRGKINMSGDP